MSKVRNLVQYDNNNRSRKTSVLFERINEERDLDAPQQEAESIFKELCQPVFTKYENEQFLFVDIIDMQRSDRVGEINVEVGPMGEKFTYITSD